MKTLGAAATVLCLGATVLAVPPQYRLRPAAAPEFNSSQLGFWRAASGDVVLASGPPSHLIYSRGWLGTATEVPTPMGDAAVRFEDSAVT